MVRWIALPFVVVFATKSFAQEELPKDPEQSMDIEPPLLIQETPNQNIVPTKGATGEQKPIPDVDQLIASVEKARKSAAAGERLYRAGIIAKIDAENRALRVLRLEADLAQAKLELAKQNLVTEETQLSAGEISESDVETAKKLEVDAEKDADLAIAQKEKAELDEAVLNLQRQKKLLAMGSGRKSEVNRAQEKVSALQQKN